MPFKQKSPRRFSESAGLFQAGGISGTFYNDGTSGQGFIGDVVGEVYIGGTGQVRWPVGESTNIPMRRNCHNRIGIGVFNTL